MHLRKRTPERATTQQAVIRRVIAQSVALSVHVSTLIALHSIAIEVVAITKAASVLKDSELACRALIPSAHSTADTRAVVVTTATVVAVTVLSRVVTTMVAAMAVLSRVATTATVVAIIVIMVAVTVVLSRVVTVVHSRVATVVHSRVATITTVAVATTTTVVVAVSVSAHQVMILMQNIVSRRELNIRRRTSTLQSHCA